MYGDFSRWKRLRDQNHAGVLHQQGRVLLDPDWNAQTVITTAWQDLAARQVIGSGIAAVSSQEPKSLQVTHAKVDGGQVKLEVQPGNAWADGLKVQVHPEDPNNPDAPVTRTATYLEPPLQAAGVSAAGPNSETRDAVVLEVWREALNAFQTCMDITDPEDLIYPENLLEPALGGPDTTERLLTARRFRLLRLTLAEESCPEVAAKLHDDWGIKGQLKVTLRPTKTIPGDCPLVEGGGYVGFEHCLYRIEVARVNQPLTQGGAATQARFKWSQVNGGLVGRGDCHLANPADRKITITANDQAIQMSGLESFYLEVVEFDPDQDCWRTTYGAEVSLNGLVLEVGQEHYVEVDAFGLEKRPSDKVFFRLWNGIKPIVDFLKVAALTEPSELNDGIRLEFDADSGSNYQPEDYWTFPVRAGEISHPDPLLQDQPPQGIHYHRVPVAILNWKAGNDIDQKAIEDCRHVFRPLTQQTACCTFVVGDGVSSHGDFDTIQEALNHLPSTGGQVCVLPGLYQENLVIEKKNRIIISGCGRRTKILAKSSDAVVHLKDADDILLESLNLVAHKEGPGVLLEGTAKIALSDLRIEAKTRSAIEGDEVRFFSLRRCLINMEDVAGAWPAVFLIGQDLDIEENLIQVIPTQGFKAAAGKSGAFLGKGGIQLGGLCQRVRIINNLIDGGADNGITLGSLKMIKDSGEEVGRRGKWFEDYDPCTPTRPGRHSFPPEKDTDEGRWVSAGVLQDINLEGNRIYHMGLNGIGVCQFFDLADKDEIISVQRLKIFNNEIRHCLRRPLEPIEASMVDSIGYGGIALGDVDYLVIQNNIIADNGPNYLEPVCGIFVLHGEGIDISQNHILNNDPKTDKAAGDAKNGRRGGINIVYAVAPTVLESLPGEFDIPVQNGFPAAKIHHNIVSVSLGQALSLTALGPVSVLGNQFTSRGVVFKPGTLTPSFLGGTVCILNLGVSNEFYGQLMLFDLIRKNQMTRLEQLQVTDTDVIIPQVGLDDVRLGQYLANGNVLFSNNQCSLDLLEKGATLTLSSILIFSFDDIGFIGNQCDANLLGDFVISQAVLYGISLRVCHNRFKEGVSNALYSAITLGIANITTDNQSTHCLAVSALPNLLVKQPNSVLLEVLSPRYSCEGLPKPTHDSIEQQ